MDLVKSPQLPQHVVGARGLAATSCMLRPVWCILLVEALPFKLVPSRLPHLNIPDKYEREAGRYWDLFYRRNENRFFKDRHWFESEFPQLLRASTVLEVRHGWQAAAAGGCDEWRRGPAANSGSSAHEAQVTHALAACCPTHATLSHPPHRPPAFMGGRWAAAWATLSSHSWPSTPPPSSIAATLRPAR